MCAAFGSIQRVEGAEREDRRQEPARTRDHRGQEGGNHCASPAEPMVRLNEIRTGEVAIELPDHTDAEIYFIGRIRTPWTDRLTCPRQGRLDGPTCQVEVFPPWDKGLDSVASLERL